MRIFRLIATPVILLALLGVLIWGAMWGWKALTEPLPSPSPTPCVTASSDTVTTTQVTVRVFNGGFTSGLANRVSTRLKDDGFHVVKVGNVEERFKEVVIRANAREVAQVRLVASRFIEPKIEHDNRVDGTVDVMLPTDFPGWNEKKPEEGGPLAQVSSDRGKLCVPPTKTPSPTPTPTQSQEP